MNLYADLFLTFARVGVCTFGGGYAMLPILQRELVEKKGWMTEEALADCFAIGQCTPGVIAVNTATFVGFQKKGNAGGMLATLGVVFPSVVILMVIAAFLEHFADLPVVVHAFAGVRACVCALILSSVLKLRKTTVVDRATAVIFAGVFLLAVFSGAITGAAQAIPILGAVLSAVLSPVVLIVVAGVCGLVLRKTRGWKV